MENCKIYWEVKRSDGTIGGGYGNTWQETASKLYW